MTVIVLLIVAAVALLLLFVGYKLNAALGIFLEGIMCWSALSVKSLKLRQGSDACCKGRQSFFGTAQGKKVTFRDTDDMNIDAVIKARWSRLQRTPQIGRSHLFSGLRYSAVWAEYSTEQ